ncbi:dTMP kinase [Streptomyces sp. NPDC006632]|uniref:dTMP kinase n=1 Tax=Streptomyces sp. NPDC006632 TaxID=3157182 RepID=UPI00339F5532
MSGPGFFLTLDGPGGVGKSTVVGEVHDLLAAGDAPALATTEPSRTPLGELLRKSTGRYKGHSYAHLIAGDRLDHLASTVVPAVERGVIVVSDRYVASSLVLQRMDGLTLEEIWSINQPLVAPSLSVILTADTEEIGKRLAKRGQLHSRFEEMEDSTGLEVRYYEEAAAFLATHGFDIVTIDCTALSASQVAARIVQEIDIRQTKEGLTHE